MSLDEFGVPDQLFGVVPEDEYRLVGRVVTVAALVEVTLNDLLTELEQVPQTQYAGQQAGAMLKRAEAVIGAGGFRADYVTRARPVLACARKVFEQRNAIVHGVRPVQDSAPGLAWRPVRLRQRPEPGSPIVAVSFTLEDLAALVVELVDLQAELADLRVRSSGARLSIT